MNQPPAIVVDVEQAKRRLSGLIKLACSGNQVLIVRADGRSIRLAPISQAESKPTRLKPKKKIRSAHRGPSRRAK